MILDNALLLAWICVGTTEISASAWRMTTRSLYGERFDLKALLPPLEPMLGALSLTLAASGYALLDPPIWPRLFFFAWITIGHLSLRVICATIAARGRKQAEFLCGKIRFLELAVMASQAERDRMAKERER